MNGYTLKPIHLKLVGGLITAVFAAGGLVTTVQHQGDRLQRIEDRNERIEEKVDWLVARELAAGPPAPIEWDVNERPAQSIDRQGLLALP